MRPTRRGPGSAPGRRLVPGRLRVGTRLMLLVMLPVAGLLAFTVFSAVAQWQEADELRRFQAATQVSFAAAEFTGALARERAATVTLGLRPGSAAEEELKAAKSGTDLRLQQVAEHAAAGGQGSVDVVGRLDAARRQLRALRYETEAGSLGIQPTAQRYGDIVESLHDTVRELAAGRPARASGKAADGYLAILAAIEAAERERVDLADAFARPHGGRQPPASRWATLEEAELNVFRQNKDGGPLPGDLLAVLSEPPGAKVAKVRTSLTEPPDPAVELISLHDWLTASGDRIDGLRKLERAAAGDLAAAASHDLATTETRADRELGVSVAVTLVVAALAEALRRSIARPLEEVSKGARTMSSGDLTFDVHYVGRDEIGDVADAFRDLHVMTERLAGEIREMNAAITANRLDHRADVASFEGTWSQLLGGMNGTMAAFAGLHGRRRRAELELEGIFNLSLDMLCVSGPDGYFKRVNPSFEETLGYPREELLARPFLDFVHPDDRARTLEVLSDLTRGQEILQFENRYIRSDGTERWLQWNARLVPDEGLIYSAARDVTDRRRAAREQAALRHVATLVAKGVPPTEIFGAVASEVVGLLGTGSAEVLRYGSGDTVTVLGSAPGAGDWGRHVAAKVARTRSAARTDRAVGAPIFVEDRLWGVVVAESGRPQPLPADTEARLVGFTELIATAIANADSRAELAASRARVVAAGDETRRRLERDLHDGVQQRLVSLMLELRAAEAVVPSGADDLRGELAHIATGMQGAFDDLLEISRGIHPAILSDGGLGPALRTLARRSTLPVEVDLRAATGLRLPDHVEVAAYYVVSEALTNAAKHAQATMVLVVLEPQDGVIELSIQDDGVGGATPGRGSGLVGLTDRVEAIGGKIRITSPAGGGTSLVVTLPTVGS